MTDEPREIRERLSGIVEVCETLGLLEGAKKHSRGLFVCCPVHNERTPSCSVTLGPDRTIRFRCFGCQASGDVFHLAAAAWGLDLKTNFREVLVQLAAMAGVQIVDSPRGLNMASEKPARPVPRVLDQKTTTDLSGEQNDSYGRSGDDPVYPDPEVVKRTWDRATPACDDTEVSGHLVFRRLDPDLVTRLDLARVISQPLPTWARFKGQTWLETGHRLLVPMWSADGVMASVRAWRVTDGETPKRLPPAGHKLTGLVIANPVAVRMLRGEFKSPVRLILVEGEPDAFCWGTRSTSMPVIGVVSGSWTADFAARIPYGSEISVRTHHDPAGDKYAEQITETVKHRAVVFRSRAA